MITSPSRLKPLSGFTRHLKPELLATETRVPDLTPANLLHHWSESYLFPASLCTGCHAHAIPKVAWLTSFYPTGLNGHVFSFSDHPIELDIPLTLSPPTFLQSPDTICNFVSQLRASIPRQGPHLFFMVPHWHPALSPGYSAHSVKRMKVQRAGRPPEKGCAPRGGGRGEEDPLALIPSVFIGCARQ